MVGEYRALGQLIALALIALLHTTSWVQIPISTRPLWWMTSARLNRS